MSFTGYDDGTHGAPKPGDFFTIDDDSDSNHTKMYQVVRAETRTNYENQPPLDRAPTRLQDYTQFRHFKEIFMMVQNLYSTIP